jgi:hypothetical protein
LIIFGYAACLFIYLYVISIKNDFPEVRLSYTVKFVVIISIVGVVSFFVASLVIPEKNAVAPSRKKSAPKALVSSIPPAGGDIPVVVVDDKPADKPILVSDLGSAQAPIDHKALAPGAKLQDDAKTPPPAVAMADTRTPPAAVNPLVNTTVSAPQNVPVNALKAPPATAAAAYDDAKSVTFSTQIDTVAEESVVFVGRSMDLPSARLAPPNTMAARLIAEAAPPKVTPPPAAPTPVAPPAAAATVNAPASPPPVATATLAVTPADTVKKRPDSNAPLGYRLTSTAVCSGVENRAPKDVADRFPRDAAAVYYFTQFVGATDTNTAVLHKWYREGKLIQTSILQIKSASWRTHSKRNLATVDDPTGSWRVDAVDQRSGKVLSSTAFVVE